MGDGDLIISVNGTSGDSQLVIEMLKTEILVMVLRHCDHLRYENKSFGPNQKVIRDSVFYFEAGRTRLGKGKWHGCTFAVEWGPGQTWMCRAKNPDLGMHSMMIERPYGSVTEEYLDGLDP